MISIITEKIVDVCDEIMCYTIYREICEQSKMIISDNKLLRATLLQQKVCVFFVIDLRALGHKMVLVAFPFMDIFCLVIFSFL